MSSEVPKLEKEARASVELSMAPTVIADGAEAGEVLPASWFSLPAATTTVTPALVNAAIAELSAADFEPPIEIFNTALPESLRAVAFVETLKCLY